MCIPPSQTKIENLANHFSKKNISRDYVRNYNNSLFVPCHHEIRIKEFFEHFLKNKSKNSLNVRFFICVNGYMLKIYKLLNSLVEIFFDIHFMSNMSIEHEFRVKMKFKENKVFTIRWIEWFYFYYISLLAQY